MSEFIKIGENITPAPKLDGVEYELKSGKVYDLLWDNFNNRAYLKENGTLNMPKKLYKLESDDKFINKVLTYFNSEKSNNTTSALFSGDKGTGKTMLAKRIAIESNLPIIVVSNSFCTFRLTNFFKKFTTPVVIMFDEFEKNELYWKLTELLGFLDGIESTCKKLVLMTCNETKKIDTNLLDRCSRIRYHRKYEANSNDMFIKYLAEDKGIAEDKIDELTAFITKNMKVRSFDNIAAFIDEVNLFGDIASYDEIFNDMSLTRCNK